MTYFPPAPHGGDGVLATSPSANKEDDEEEVEEEGSAAVQGRDAKITATELLQAETSCASYLALAAFQTPPRSAACPLYAVHLF